MVRLVPTVALAAALMLLPKEATGSQPLRILLKDGKSLSGEKVSENTNFLVIDVGGSNISLYKELIQSVEPADDTASIPTIESAAPSAAGTHNEPSRSPLGGATTNAVPPAAPADNPFSLLRHLPRPSFDQLVGRAEQVELLDLSFMDLDRLPDEIVLFKKVRRLDLKGNRLEELPAGIGDLTSLRDLDLRLNRIKHLPPEVMNLTGLKRLYLTGNRIPHERAVELKAMLPFTQIIDSPSDVVDKRKNRPMPLSSRNLAIADSLDILCEAGNAMACRALGELMIAHRDAERALNAFASGCDRTASALSPAARSSCMQAGKIFDDIYRNRDRAMEYYRHTCIDSAHAPEAFCRELEAAER